MATIYKCGHLSCKHNEGGRCQADEIEIDEFLHCSSWED
jgi:hypothetical protein